MDFWKNEEENIPNNVQPLKTKKDEGQAINFDDFQNFENEADEKEKSEDLLQSQDFENSKNKIEENLFSQEEFSYHFQQQNQNNPNSNPFSQQNLSNHQMNEKQKHENPKIESIKVLKEEKQIEKNTKKIEPNKEMIYCSVHDEEGGFFYCRDCQSFNICVQCIVKGFHKSHDVLNLRNNQLNLKQKYGEILKKILDKKEELLRKDKRIIEQIENSNSMLNHNKHLIRVFFQEIRVNFEKKEKEFINKIEEISKKDLLNHQNTNDYIKKNINFIDDNLKNLGSLSNSDEFLIYKMILDGSLENLLKHVNSFNFDENLSNNLNKSQTQDEETLNKTMSKINNFLVKINDSLENCDIKFEDSIINHNLIERKQKIFEEFSKYNKQEEKPEEKTVLVSLQKAQDSISFRNTKAFNNSPPKEENPTLSRLRNEIKSMSPTKQIFHEYINNPISSSTHKEISNYFDKNKASIKVSSYSSFNAKATVIKRSYISPEINNMKNSFLNQRTLFQKNNYNTIKESKFFGVDELKNTLFEHDRPQRLKHFQNINKINMEKLTFKKEKRLFL